MKKNRYIVSLFAALVLCSSCGESLFDTYKDYAGEGEIRYIGKCTDLSVVSGWKRLIVRWDNNDDQIIKQVKVTWESDGVRDSVLLDRGTKEYDIRTLCGAELTDGSYEVSVSGVDAQGKSSIPTTQVGRPFSYTHEAVISFNRLISKSYLLHDRLILKFLGWHENMIEAKLVYTKKGEEKESSFNITPEVAGQKYYMLEDEIDVTKPIVVYRKGELEGCQDVVDMEPYPLTKDKVFGSELTSEVKRQFGYNEVPVTWADTVTTFHLDWSIGSFEDIMNLPRLTKLVLGSRRYILPGEEDSEWAKSEVAEKEESDFALQVMHELTGLTVERYNNHFRNITPADFIEDKGNTNVQPVIVPLDLTDLTFEVYPEEVEDYDSDLDHLIDGNVLTNWNPYPMDAFVTYELILDLKEARKLKGIKITQPQFRDTPREIAVAQEMVKVKVSNNKAGWENATYLEESKIGKSNGEVSYIDFTEHIREGEYQYVMIQINTSLYTGRYYTKLAEIALY